MIHFLRPCVDDDDSIQRGYVHCQNEFVSPENEDLTMGAIILSNEQVARNELGGAAAVGRPGLVKFVKFRF